MDTPSVTNQKFSRLKNFLMELFQLDQPELDFGLYRVMHARSKEVVEFLEKDLLPQVSAIFDQYRSSDTVGVQEELKAAINQAKELGADPDTLPKVRDLKARLATSAVDVSRLESEVYDHLYTFFRRYYHEGDFLSRRVYKDGVYAIPYSGEEVKLHWANADQYYIKTDEYLRNFSFRLNPTDDNNPLRVHFRIKSASEGEHGNIKAQENGERRFVLCESDFIEEEDGETGTELVINFEYRQAEVSDWGQDNKAGKKAPPLQRDLISIAVKRISECDLRQIQKWLKPLLAKAATDKDKDRTVLEKHLDRYTKRNTFDYFIHKDLGGFLRREVDFYIKNEVMHLDDVENETAPKVEQYLSKIKAIRKVAGKIIDFLAQLEDFQKKLWLKKKFVVETNYCITLDRIPEEFYPEIAANEEQRKEWVKLFAIDEIKGDLVTPGYSEPLTVNFIKNNRNLILDTHFFSEEVKARLISNLANLGNLSGILFHAENFHALNLQLGCFRNKIQSIYIDPPYNTAASEIAYKNEYKHSSWLSLMMDRVRLSHDLLLPSGIMQVAIDEAEGFSLKLALDSLFGPGNFVSSLAIQQNPRGRADAMHISPSHEYLHLYSKDYSKLITNQLQQTAEELGEKYKKSDGTSAFRELPFKRSGSNSRRQDRPNLFYPIFYSPSLDKLSLTHDHADSVLIKPVDSAGEERVWRWGREKASSMFSTDFIVRKGDHGNYTINVKDRLKSSIKPKSFWYGARHDASSHGTILLANILGNSIFSYPKSINTVFDCIQISTQSDSLVLDYFGGSGTTAHAVFKANRDDDGQRRFIIVEMGSYFDIVLKPRILKTAYCDDWKSEKPCRRDDSLSVIIKYIRLESYEDALNNLESKRPAQAQLALDSRQSQGVDGFKEQYILKYMLDVETKGSQSLLNIQDFKDPTAYKMQIKRPGTDESRPVNVDLLETFNWLLGLTVDHIAAPQTFTTTFERDEEKRLVLASPLKQSENGSWWFRTVTGKDTDGRSVLVIWRKRPGGDEPQGIEQDNLALNEWFTKLGFSTRDREFDLIYVNGSNNLENVRTPDERWKVRLIEEDFMRLMFDVEDI